MKDQKTVDEILEENAVLYRGSVIVMNAPSPIYREYVGDLCAEAFKAGHASRDQEIAEKDKRIEKLRGALSEAFNKLDCCIVGCYHKTKLVNSSMCSAHTAIYNAIFQDNKDGVL